MLVPNGGRLGTVEGKRGMKEFHSANYFHQKDRATVSMKN